MEADRTPGMDGREAVAVPQPQLGHLSARSPSPPLLSLPPRATQLARPPAAHATAVRSRLPTQAAPHTQRPFLPEAGACLFALLIQVTMWCSTAVTGLPLRGHLHQVLICTGFCFCYWIARHPGYCQSRFWQRHRPVVITSLRLVLGTIPANRSSTEGLASLLWRNASPGLRGVVHDYLRFVTGTHVFLIAVGPPLLALPPLAALVLNTGLMALTHNPGYCDTQLTSHALSRQRLRLVAGAVDIALAAPPSAVGAVVSKPVHSMDDRQTCVAFFTLQQAVLGVLLPAVAASWVPKPRLPGPEPAAAEEPPPQPQQQQQQQQQQQCGSLWQRATSWPGRTFKSVAAACEWADDVLTKCFCSACPPTLRHVVGAWLVCSELWLLAKVVATHSA